MKKWQFIGSVLFMWLVLVSMAIAQPAGMVGTTVVRAPDGCTEKGWYFGLLFDGDSMKVAGHGPLGAWGRETLMLPGGKNAIKVHTSRMWEGGWTQVEVELASLVPREGYEPTFEIEETLRLTRRNLACQWTSEPDASGTMWSFGNLRVLASRGHPTHRNLETYETLETPQWR